MFIPIGDTQVKGGVKPVFSYTFIIINVLVFLYQLSLPLGPCQYFVSTYGFIPSELGNFEKIYTLISSMFLHASWMHLIGNMIFLWIFADNIEAVVGKGEFVFFYFSGGIAAAMAHYAFNINSSIPAIGASGAIAAVLGAYLVLFPKSKIKVMFILFFYTWRMPAVYFLAIWFIQQLFSGIGSMGIDTAGTNGVAWWAHIGGFLFGVIYGYFKRQNLYIPYSFIPR